jgi:hypothetical protein
MGVSNASINLQITGITRDIAATFVVLTTPPTRPHDFIFSLASPCDIGIRVLLQQLQLPQAARHRVCEGGIGD